MLSMLLKEAENVTDFLTEIVKLKKKTVLVLANKICLCRAAPSLAIRDKLKVGV